MNDFERLREIVDADPQLQVELLQMVESAEFVAAVMRLAVERDLVVAEGNLWQAIEAGRAIYFSTWSP